MLGAGTLCFLLSLLRTSPSFLSLASPAKINLWLRVLGKRPDGFHEVETRLCKLALADTVRVEHHGPGGEARLTCNVAGIPLDESNLALKALRAFEERSGLRGHGWSIHLEKRVPHGAGLGGGSSNAATVLRAVNELTGRPLSLEELLDVAGPIGADVPGFLLPTGAADGVGKGERVTPVAFPWRLPLLLIKPPFPIPTPWAYKNWAGSVELPGVPYAPQAMPWGEMVNGLERPVFEKYRLLAALKGWLLEQRGVSAALMSGSGSTVFAVLESTEAAEALLPLARAWCGPETLLFVTETLGDD